MLSLLISTLEMMGVTFLIGFFVAAVIKGIAAWTDRLDSHKPVLVEETQLSECNVKTDEDPDDEREDFRNGINRDIVSDDSREYYHGVSPGASNFSLLDYYYPDDRMHLHIS